MVVTLKKSGDSFTFILPPQVAADLALVDGSTIDIQPATEPQPPPSATPLSMSPI